MNTITKETKETLHKLLDNTGVIMLYLDNQENVIFCNKKLMSITGLTQEEIIGKNWLNILFRDKNSSIKKDLLKAVMDDSMKYKRGKDFEGIILDKDGNERFIAWNLAPIQTENNQTEGNILAGNDITAIKERESSLKNIGETLKNILSGIKEYALYLINLDGNITYFGMGSEIMLGYNKQDIIFKHVSILHNFESPANLQLILENVRNFGKYETEIDLVTKNKGSIPVILTVNQFLDSTGKLSGYIFIAKDITERKKLEYQIFQAEKLAALGQLSAGMAHEINNPLFVISGRLEMLKDEKLNQKTKDSLNLINAQTDRIRKLVDRILKFARKTTPTFEPIAINDVIELALPLIYYNNLPMSKIEIKKNFEKQMPNIKGDLHQLQEVFLNLLINACQSMPNGGVIEITTTNFQNLYAQIQISDTGMGMPASHLKDIFMPFFSTKHDGTGLGLSICHNIIKNHNGSIELKSQVNQGTTFTIKLPFN
jgi:two-component system sensor histidine kinase AtoS